MMAAESAIPRVSVCDICGKSYNQRSSLSRHKKNAHGKDVDVDATINCSEINCNMR
jgi:hypothetical protein